MVALDDQGSHLQTAEASPMGIVIFELIAGSAEAAARMLSGVGRAWSR
jgi:hypothetical protein